MASDLLTDFDVSPRDGENVSYLYIRRHEAHVVDITHRVLRDNVSLDSSDANLSLTLSMGRDTTQRMPPRFDDVSMTKTVVFGAMFVMSFIGNVATLVQMYRMRRRKSTINTLIVNLALADLLVTFFCIAGEAAWAATVQWYGGTAVCKILKYMQVFALYLSTYITVAISLDRCIAILDPMRRNGAPVRVRTMIVLAWFFSAFFSIPQAIIFNVKRGPFKEEFYQCVTYGSYVREWQRQLYSIASLLLMFVIPLVTIGTAYGLIFCTINRKSKEFSVLDGISLLAKRRTWSDHWQTYRGIMCLSSCDVRHQRKESIISSNSAAELTRGPVRSNLLRKAKRKSLRMSIVIVLAFIICWTPYYVIFICRTFFKWREIDPRTLLWFFFIGMTNSMLNPMIYGAFQLCKVHIPSSWRKEGSPDSSLKKRGSRGRNSNFTKGIPASNSSFNTPLGSKRRLIGSNSRGERCCHHGPRSHRYQHHHRFFKYGNCQYCECKKKTRRHTTGDLRSYCCFHTY